MTNSKTLMAVLATILIGAAAPAGAVDGCQGLLCLAGPWQRLPASVGAGYSPSLSNEPSASTASAANSWLGQWAPAPDPSCPSKYVTSFSPLGRTVYGCQFRGVIAVRLNGQVWSRTYWNLGGGSATELSSYAQSVDGVTNSTP